MSEVLEQDVEQRAADLSRRLHTAIKQKYRINGESVDYFDGHIEPVATLIREMGYGPKTVATGYLHDTIEDTGVTAENLVEAGVPEDVVSSVVAITKVKGESMDDYRKRIAQNPRAAVAKYADSTRNLQQTLLSKATLPPAKFAEWQQEYSGNIEFLKPYLPSPTELPD